jgi:hypothetical protein
MNYLAHTQLLVDKNNPWLVLGSIFPDLAKRAQVNFREKHLEQVSNEIPEAFSNGIRLHFLGDKLFHNSELFFQGSLFWKHLLASKNLVPDKSFFLHHLVFEMHLDRIIMAQNKDEGQNFYDKLGELENSALDTIYRKSFRNDAESLLSAFQLFMNRKFILAYPDDKAFSGIAVGVFSNITKQVPEPIHFSKMEEALRQANAFENQIWNYWIEFQANFMP